jgi:hypothetical protein
MGFQKVKFEQLRKLTSELTQLRIKYCQSIFVEPLIAAFLALEIIKKSNEIDRLKAQLKKHQHVDV